MREGWRKEGGKEKGERRNIKGKGNRASERKRMGKRDAGERERGGGKNRKGEVELEIN